MDIWVRRSIGLQIVLIAVAFVGCNANLPKDTSTSTTPATASSDHAEPDTVGPGEFVSESTGMRLRLIPAGEFRMGSTPEDIEEALKEFPDQEGLRRILQAEGPQHTVQISTPFYMAVTEVTQEHYNKTMGTNPSFFSTSGEGHDFVDGQDTSLFPVELVSWNDAIEFCNKLSLQDGLPPYYDLWGIDREEGSIKSMHITLSRGDGYRLPTEAEWEYACRANTATPFNFGSKLNGDKANVDGNLPYGTPTKGKSLGRTTTVGSYGVNGFGLSDMHGNVEEWCFDVYDETEYEKRSGTTIDPRSASRSERCVYRGGSYCMEVSNARSARRNGIPAHWRSPHGGFRVIRSAQSTPEL